MAFTDFVDLVPRREPIVPPVKPPEPIDYLLGLLNAPVSPNIQQNAESAARSRATMGQFLQPLNDLMNSAAGQSIQQVFPPQAAAIRTPADVIRQLRSAGSFQNAVREGEKIADIDAPEALNAVWRYISAADPDRLLGGNVPMDEIALLRAISSQLLRQKYGQDVQVLRATPYNKRPRGLSYSLFDQTFPIANQPFVGDIFRIVDYGKGQELARDKDILNYIFRNLHIGTIPSREVLASHVTQPHILNWIPSEREVIRLPENLIAKLHRVQGGPKDMNLWSREIQPLKPIETGSLQESINKLKALQSQVKGNWAAMKELDTMKFTDVIAEIDSLMTTPNKPMSNTLKYLTTHDFLDENGRFWNWKDLTTYWANNGNSN